MAKFYKEESKKNYWVDDTQLTIEHINAGSLQRIADATELMAKNHSELQWDKDNYKRWYESEKAKTAGLKLRVAALKGVITKLKKEPKSHAVVTNED